MLRKAEEMARGKGAKKALLTTFEFQGKTFYEQRGFTVTGKVEDYPPGMCDYTMVKKL